MSTTFVSSGVTSSGLTETGANTLEVLNGGSAVQTTLSGGGQLLVDAGGYAVGTTISSGGSAVINTGGAGDRFAVSSGGTLNVAGTVNSFTAVFTGGVENIEAGGFISGAVGSGTGISGGTVNVLAGGSASYLSVSSGGVFNVAGTTLSMIGVRSGGVENVLSGGFISGATSSGTGISAGGILNLQAGGSAVHVGVSSGGTFNVAGSVLSNTAIYAGGIENVLSGGSISGASGSGTGVSGGTLNLSAGGSASYVGVSAGGIFNVAGTVLSSVGVYSGGVENVLSGGVVQGVSGGFGTAISGGTVNVQTGGTATAMFVYASGALNDSGIVTNQFVLSGGVETVSSGGLASGVQVSGGGLLDILAGGSATNVGDAGKVIVEAGGSVDHITVSAGGVLSVGGTVTSNTSVLAGGVETVLSGGLISGASGSGTGISGGTVNLLAGGSAAFVGVSSGGIFNVAGTVLSNGAVRDGGIENVLSGGLITGAISSGTGVSAGGVLNVLAGGSAAFVGVSSGGTFNVSGTFLSMGSVYDGGVENVVSGGVVTGVTGSGTGISGGTVNVFGGGALDHLTVSSGTLNVSAGATVHNITVSSGGTMNVAGTITSNTLVSSGGIENVLSGGLISGATNSGTGVLGTLNLLAGGSAAHVGVSSGGTFNVAGTVLGNVGVYDGGVENVLSGGVVTGVPGSGTGVSGGTVNVLAGGALDHLTVSSGTLNVSAGGTAHDLTVSSGTLNVAGTIISNTLVSSGGIENVLSGGFISGASSAATVIFAGGTVNVLAGGSATHIGVSSGGTFNVAGNVLSNTGIYNGGVENVLSGGSISGASGSGTGISGGTLNLSAGATAAFVGVSSGGIFNVAGTVQSNVTVYNGGVENVLAGGLITGAVSSGTGVSAGGVLNVLAGGTAAFVGVSSGGTFNVSGTVLSRVGVYVGGVENVFSGGVVTGATGSGTAISGGTVNVFSGGALDHLTVSSGGVLNVSSGGTAHNIAVSSGGTFNLAGTTTSNVTVFAGGNELVSSGGSTGPVTISGGVVELQAGSIASGGITFSGSGGQLKIDSTSMPTTTISGLVLGDSIDLAGVTFSAGGSATLLAGNVLQVTEGGTSYDLQLDQTPGVRFSVGTDSGTGTLVTTRADIAPVASAPNVTAIFGESSALASSLFSVTDADGDPITQYAFWDTQGNGHWVVNGVVQATNAEIDVGAANLSQVSYVFGPSGSTDTLFVRANDGTVWGGWTQFTAKAFADTAPTVNAVNVTAAHGQTSVAASSLFTVSDPDPDTMTQYAFWDTGGSGHWVVNGVAQAANTEIDITAAQLSQVSYVFGPTGSAPDTLFIRANDGTLWGGWKSFTASPGADTAPVVTAANVTANHGQTSALASSLFSVTDADGDAITQYAFWDTGGSGHWVVNGVAQAANTEIDVAAANLSQVSYVFGPGSSPADTLYVRANDGMLWGSWTAFTASPGPDNAPVVTAPNVTAVHGEASALASSLFSVTDADGDTITQYAFWDTGGNGHWVVNGVAQAANTEIDVSAANLSQVSYVFGPGGSTSDTLYVRANDGQKWSTWAAFTATPGSDTAPVVTAPNVTASHGETSALASSLFSVTDADGDTITKYAFWDTGGSGHWVVNGVAQAANTEIDVSAANLSQVSYVFGPGGSTPDTLFVRANDGSLWSTWASFTAGPGVDTAPVVTAPNVTAVHGEASALASSLFSVTDADGDTITQYAFWDTGGNGHWVVNGVAQAANTEIDVSAANLSQVSYVFGPGGSTSDTLFVRANDGSKWGIWTAFTASPGPDNAPVVTAPNVTAVHGEASALASSLFSVTDADGDTISQYAFWDTGGNGHWVVNGVAQTANTEIDVSAANLSQVSYVFGPGGSTSDTLFVRANDGSEWGAWTAFTATPGPDNAPVVTAPNVAANHGQFSALASSLFSVTDADGDPITQYAFWDTGGNGHWVVNGVAQAANTEIDVAAANLSQVSYVYGPGGSPADTLYVRANDGSKWSTWTAFTATPGPDTAPVVTAANATGIHDHSVAASTLFSTSDAESDPITQYAFWDTGGNGHWVVNGVAQAANAEIDVAAANLSQVSYVFGPGGSPSDTLYVRANDGSEWSSWKSFTATATNQAPTVSVANVVTVSGQTFAAASLVTATDADGDAITKYALWDSNTNGRWNVGGVNEPANTEIDVTAAQLSQATYQAGSGTDQLWIRANDGTAWGAWQSFNVTGESPSSATIVPGGTLELTGTSSANVTFQGSTGTLKLDNSASFSGTVAGMTGSDAIDFANINFASVHTPSFSGDSSHGTLTVTDGTVTASIALLGNYMASTFTTSSDGHGGTLVVDPPATQVSQLAQPQHA